MPAHGRQAKRPFQPSITSFFSRADEALSSPSRSEPLRNSAPTLPATVQTSLLNVGMRIRKSVPEGYQTKRVGHSASSGPISTKPALGSSQPLQRTAQARTRELAPFCGILKVGGYDIQDNSCSPDLDDVPPLDHPDIGEDGLPMSSQESNDPFVSAYPTSAVNPGKRHYEEEDDEVEAVDPVIYEDDAGLHGSLDSIDSMGHEMVQGLGFSRPLAQPKTRRRNVSLSIKPSGGDQENAGLDASLTLLDFGEAPFLQPSEVLGHDVHMDDF